MYLMIENQGEADKVGMRLMGASSKEETEAIGRFGTGWKYGIAGTLRLAGDFYICIGAEQHSISTAPVELRGQRHDEATIDGVPIGITNQLGKDWLPWMVLREFISNAIDEGGCVVSTTDRVEPAEGRTRVYVPLEPFQEVYDNLDDYFCLSDVEGQVVTPLGRALPKRDHNEVRIYKKGVLVKRTKGSSAFDYELANVAVGEDRLAGDVRRDVWQFLDAAPLEVKIVALNGQFEAECYQWESPSKEWKEAFGSRLVVSSKVKEVPEEQLIVNYKFVEVAERVGARTMKTDQAAKSAERQTMPATYTVKEVCKRLKKLDIVIDQRIILMADIDGYLVEGGLIYLSKSLDELGITEALIIVGTISGYEGSLGHLQKLAALVRRAAKL